MKIEKLWIYGFGKHENVTIDFGPKMNVLFGENEAGKTTIQQFILHILFGFPQRNGTNLRYEPKSGGKYGGQIQIVDDVYGRCTIERVRGKSAGDVTVYFEDGKRGGEEALAQLLRQYDRASFEAIFSFSLLQLQGFEKMTEAELSRTLLASGTTGVDLLLKLETKMDKEMDELFKKSGRIPFINAKITEIRTFEKELQEAQQKVIEYTPAMDRIREIDEQVAKLNEQREKEQAHHHELIVMQQVRPLQDRKEQLTNRLTQLGDTDFPVDGIRRFEAFMDKVDEAEVTKKRLEMELRDIEKAYAVEVSSDRLARMEVLLGSETEWHHWQSISTTATTQLKRLEEERETLLNLLGMREELEIIAMQSANVSLQKEEEMVHVLGEIDRIGNEIGTAEDRFNAMKEDLEQAQEKVSRFVQPTDEEMKQVKEWPEIRQRLADAKAYIAYGGKGNDRSSSLMIGIFLAAIVLLGLGFIQSDWLLVSVGVVGLGIGLFLYVKKAPTADQKVEEIKQFLAQHEGREREVEQLIATIDRNEREKERLDAVIEELQLKLNGVEGVLDRLYLEIQQLEYELDQLIVDFGFQKRPSSNIIPELFRMIRETQKVFKTIKELREEKNQTEQKIAERVVEIQTVLQQTVPKEALYEFLRSAYLRLNDEVEKKTALKNNIEQLQAALKETTLQCASLQAQITQLFQEAHVTTAEAFYNADRQQQEKESISEQLITLQQQLATYDSTMISIHRTEQEIKSGMVQIEASLAESGEASHLLFEEKAALVNKTASLLADHTYGDQLQAFEVKKAELSALAKKWATRKMISAAIKQMMDKRQQSQLPDVLMHAEKIFKTITGGKYEALTLTEQGYFEVIATNGTHFPIVELSQATKEQAYISLRLALATSVLETAPFPIIIDDPFVHFDEGRLSSMIEVLDESNKHQFIYFTCDKRMKDKWMDAKIINVSTLGNEQEVNR